MEKKTLQKTEDSLAFFIQEVSSPEYLGAKRRIEAGSHPTDRMLYNYVLNWVYENDAKIIMKHLAFCGICAAKVLQIRQVEGELEEKLSDWTDGKENRLYPLLTSSFTRERDTLLAKNFQEGVATEYWEPLFAGQLATAADIPVQEHLFKREEGDIEISCYWGGTYVNKPAFIKLSWKANIRIRSEILARFINPETQELRSEVCLGTHLTGEEAFTSQELGFDPLTENWAIAIVLRELG
jgi:hypothetical protein